jgi:bifunctional DNase/RNase
MRETVVAEVGICACCLQAQVLLQPVGGTIGVILPLDYAVAMNLKAGGDVRVHESCPFLMDRLLSVFAVKGFTLQRVVVDIASEAVLVGKVLFARHTLTETFLCSPSEALLFAARARVPIWVTDAVFSVRLIREQRTLPMVYCRDHETVSH